MLDTTINPFTKSDTSRLGFHLGEIVEELGGICQRFCQEYICYIHKIKYPDPKDFQESYASIHTT